jgi:Spy/CpxP family protein refolding chaperone
MDTKILRNGLLLAGALLLISQAPAPARATALIGSQDSGQTQAAPTQQNAPDRPDLNLTDDQKAQMKKIHEDAKAQIDAIKNDSSLSAEQQQAKIHQIHHDAHMQVEKMLTPEQRKTMRAWHRAHKTERQPETPPSN